MTVTDLYEHVVSWGRYASVRRIITAVCVTTSALLQAYVIQAFVNPANILAGGFTGVALLVDRAASLVGLSIPTSVGMLALNIPVAIACWRSISKRFVIFSMMQVALLSFFLEALSFPPLLPGDQMLEVLFGAVLIGLSTVIALKGGASTAGTDFIALWVSNRTGKTIWTPVFIGNCIILLIFGNLFGWHAAAYSIVFQFIATKVVDQFYHRYKRSVLLATTKRPAEVARAYTRELDHGASIINATGAFSGEPVGILHAVLSSYEVADAIKVIRDVDPRAVINVMDNQDFIGNFRHTGIDEPLPTMVSSTPEVDPLIAAMGKGLRSMKNPRWNSPDRG